MKKVLFLLSVSVILAACTHSEQKLIKTEEIPTEFKFSDLNYYVNMQTVTKDEKISPKYISKIDSINPYGFGFHCTANKLHGGKMSGVNVKTRYYFPVEGDVSIICTVSKKDSVLFWEAYRLNVKNGLKKWSDAENTFNFKKTYSGDEMLMVYLWAPKGNKAYMEELVVTPKE